MKYLKKFILAAIGIIPIAVNAQDWNTGGNLIFGTEFLGARAGSTVPLTLKTIPNLPIIFQTQGTRNRMIIMPGGTSPIDGRIAMGNNLPAGFAPAARLHLHQTGLPVIANFLKLTNNSTGITATDGFDIGIIATGIAEIRQREAEPINFFTANAQRMTIVGATTPNLFPPNTSTTYPVRVGNVGIGNTDPSTMLHIGNIVNQSGGYRDWMNVGVLSDVNSDNMYIGLKNIDGERTEAIINFGNDPSQFTNGDRMRFIFTGAVVATNGISSGADGLELGHFWTDGTNPRLGIGDFQTPNLDPQNTLEILSSASSPTRSGLRFSNLDATMAVDATANSSNTVLSVDDNGDVILVDGGGGAMDADNGLTVQTDVTNANPHIVLGGTLHDPTNIELASNDFSFDGITNSTGRVGIGTLPIAKLHVNVGGADKSTCESSIAFDPPAAYIEANRNGLSFNIAAFASATGNSNENAAGYYYANANGPGGTLYNYGVNAWACGGINNYAVYGTVNTGLNNWAGYFDGQTYVGGTIFGSDEKLKKDIVDITNAVDIIKQLEPRTFNYRTADYPSMHLSQGKQYGLIAQEVELILPELVSENTHPAKYDSLGNKIYDEIKFKGLNYNAFIAILIQGMKEQAKKDSTQQSQIDSLLTIINDQPWNNGNHAMIQSSAVTVKDVELSDKHIVVLNQNAPNPFNEQTTITYNIPEGSGFAQILFYNAAGQLIKAIDINEKGAGQLNVFANDLSNGVYSYALIVDGKVVDTKKMVKQK